MSRRIIEDFNKLDSFLTNYKLQTYTTSEKQKEECKALHKKLYGIMILIAEFNIQLKSPVILSFLDELASDLLLSLFNWVQGMYKPAKFELRSTIEILLKILLSIDNPGVFMEKSVYEIFDLAKADRHFQNKYSIKRLNQLRSDYSTLCLTVHSAPLEIHSTSALNLLPQYNEDLSQEFVVLFIRIVENTLGILYANYPTIIDRMHPENKKDFMDCLSKTTKKAINENLY